MIYSRELCTPVIIIMIIIVIIIIITIITTIIIININMVGGWSGRNWRRPDQYILFVSIYFFKV